MIRTPAHKQTDPKKKPAQWKNPIGQEVPVVPNGQYTPKEQK